MPYSFLCGIIILPMKANNEKNKPAISKWYIVSFILYVLASGLISATSMSGGLLNLFGQEIPVGLFTGVLSSISSMCLILMVIFGGKLGFITGIVLFVVQVPLMISAMVHGNMSGLSGIFSGIVVVVVNVMIYRRNGKITQLQSKELDLAKERQKGAERLFEQTATALVNAIDAKDEYSRGHSQRVAEYSRELAYLLGKSEEECIEIYYAGLLHDVGKIGIADKILNKKGKLTEEEYEVIKTHPGMGKQILSGISEYPYLSIGANHHHERYDGKGYPDKLKGTDIPEIARIIAVADAYDAMSSSRSYRDAMPQQIVREEIVKGSGTQFDPEMAKAMQHMIDIDSEYRMKERSEVKELAGKNELVCEEYREEISEGFHVGKNITTISLTSMPDDADEPERNIPSMVLFDSLDGRVHDDEKTIKDLNYFEYAEIRFDGNCSVTGARCFKTGTDELPENEKRSKKGSETRYIVKTVRVKDHVLVTIDNGSVIHSITIALPDSARYAYAALTGEHCHIDDVSFEKSDEEVADDHITRIAPLISYIEGPEGDVPNVQIDGYRTDTTKGIKVTDGLVITFHAMSLPTARLIWHCPFINLYSSNDGTLSGGNYREYALVRLDGENWESYEDDVTNELNVERKADFVGWDAWKETNKKGIDCKVRFERNGGLIIMTTENLGIVIRNITHINDKEDVYAALTGDQVALTDIRITDNRS